MAIYNLPNYVAANGFGMPLNIRRGNPDPLDNSSVWESLDAAKNYAKNDPVAYVGQILSVVDHENNIVDVYKINDEAGNLVLVGTVTLGDDMSIVKNDNDTLSLYDFGKKYYKFVAANDDVAAHYEAVEGWKDGLEPKVNGGVLAWYEPNPTTVDGLKSTIDTIQSKVDENTIDIKANTEAIAILNGDSTKEGSVAYQIAEIVAANGGGIDKLEEIAAWIAAHPTDAAEYNQRITDNKEAIDDLKDLVGTDAVVDQIAAAIDELNIEDYAKVSDLNDATDDISANADAIEELQGLVGDGTVDERIDAAVMENVDGVKYNKFALRDHGHVVSDVDGLGATLDTLATKDTVSGIDSRVKAIEGNLVTTIDSAIQTHMAAADLKYETIENVNQLSNNIDLKIDELEKADTDNLAAAKTHAETKIAELNIGQYAKQADVDTAFEAIQNHDTVDSFADVMAEIAKKQDIIPENTYDAHGAAADVDNKLEEYKIEANARLEALEKVDNATQDEMDDAVEALENADAAILAKIGTVNEGETVVGLIGAANSVAEAAQAAANDAQDDVDALERLVGTVPEGSDTVIAYINKKAEEVLNSATGGSTEDTVASVKSELDDYKTENDKQVEANAQAAADAQGKADEAYELAESKATMAEVNEAIENAGHAVAADVNAAIDGINDKIGEVPTGSTVMEEIAKAQETATYDDTDVVNKLNTLIDADADKSVREIAAEELAAQLIPANAAESLNTLQEIATWIQEHPDDASAMNDAILALQDKVDTGDKNVSTYVADAIDELGIDDYATDTELANAIAAEVERADDAYAAKSYESTVDNHVIDTTKHITAEERAAWDKAIDDLSKHKADYEIKVGELVVEDAAIRAAFAAADATLKTELQGYVDQAGLNAIAAAKAETEKQVVVEKTAREQADAGLQGAIDAINDATNGILAQAKADAASKANTAEKNAKDYIIENYLTWGTFN